MLPPYDPSRFNKYHEHNTFALPTPLNEMEASISPLYPNNHQQYFYNNQAIWPAMNYYSESKLNDISNKSCGYPQNVNASSQPSQSRAIKRARTIFSDSQLSTLERQFRVSPYLGKIRRQELAQSLKLPEHKIRIWFQNRRTKCKKKGKLLSPSSSSSSSSDTVSHVTRSEVESLNQPVYGQCMDPLRSYRGSDYSSWSLEKQRDNLNYSMNNIDSPTYIEANYYDKYVPNGSFNELILNTPHNNIFPISKSIEQDVTSTSFAEDMIKSLADDMFKCLADGNWPSLIKEEF